MINQLIHESEAILTRTFSDEQLRPMSDKLDGLISNLLSEKNIVIPSFSQDLNYLLNGGLRRGRLYILDSPTAAHGKTSLSSQIGDLASLNGFKVCYASYDSSCEQLFSSSISRLSNVKSSSIEQKKYLQDPNIKKVFFRAIAKYKDEIADNIHIIEANDLYTPNKLLEICQEIEADLLIVDYVQLLISAIKQSENYYQEILKISKVVTELKRIARQLNIPVFAVSVSNTNAYESVQRGKDLNTKAVKNIFKIAQSADVIMLLMSHNYVDLAGNNNTQLDVLADKLMGTNLNITRKIKNLAHNSPLEKDTADTYSRLIIVKNKTGKCGEVLLKYKKAVHTFEAMNYLIEKI